MRRVVVALLALAPVTAFAGKADDFMKNDVVPSVATATAAYKKHCGCNLSVKVDKSLTSVYDLLMARSMMESLTEGAEKACKKNAATKKAVCKLKKLEIKKADDTKFIFSGSSGTALTDGQSFPGFEMMMNEIDK